MTIKQIKYDIKKFIQQYERDFLALPLVLRNSFFFPKENLQLLHALHAANDEFYISLLCDIIRVHFLNRLFDHYPYERAVQAKKLLDGGQKAAEIASSIQNAVTTLGSSFWRAIEPSLPLAFHSSPTPEALLAPLSPSMQMRDPSRTSPTSPHASAAHQIAAQYAATQFTGWEQIDAEMSPVESVRREAFSEENRTIVIDPIVRFYNNLVSYLDLQQDIQFETQLISPNFIYFLKNYISSDPLRQNRDSIYRKLYLPQTMINYLRKIQF